MSAIKKINSRPKFYYALPTINSIEQLFFTLSQMVKQFYI